MEAHATRHRYPALTIAALMASGVVVAPLLPLHSPAVFFLFLLTLAVSIGILFRGVRHHEVTGSSAALVLCVLLGVVKHRCDQDTIPAAVEQLRHHEVLLQGSIRDWPQEVRGTITFAVDAEHMTCGDTVYPASFAVQVRLRKLPTDSLRNPFMLGSSVVLRGVLDTPRKARNPGEMSERRYLEANGIMLVISVRGLCNASVLDTRGGTWILRTILVPARRSIVTGIDHMIGGEEGEFLKGLMLGERAGISAATRTAFVNAGVAHILAVSGSNVAFIAAVVMFVFGVLRVPRWMQYVLTIVGLLAYMLLTGSQPPVVRATIMALVLLCGKLLQRPCDPYNAVGVAALTMMFLDTRQLFDVGFQLSFTAVMGILYLYPRFTEPLRRLGNASWLRKTLSWLLRVMAVTVAATLGTLPFSSAYFGKVSVVGLLANIIVVPISGVSLVLGFISAAAQEICAPVAEAYAALNWGLLRCTLSVTHGAGSLSWATLDAYAFTLPLAVPFYSGVMFFANILRREQRFRNLVLFLLSIQIVNLGNLSDAQDLDSGDMWVTFIDVGQGDAIFCEFPTGENLLIDTGPRLSSTDAGAKTIAPFLKRRGIRDIDHLLFTHAHDDHLGGAGALRESFVVKNVWSAFDMPGVHAGESERFVGRPVYRGGMLTTQSDLVRVYILSPSFSERVKRTGQVRDEVNNTSTVLKIVYGSVSFLLVGDAERDVERQLVEVYDGFLKSTVLKVGHHGSGTSSSEGFLTAVRPDFAVISVGQFNRFRHPSRSVLRRLEALGIPYSRTDEDGATIVVTDGTDVAIHHAEE